MRQRALLVDALAAVLVAVVVLVVSPGLAVTAIVAVIVLAGFGLHAAVRRRRGRRGGSSAMAGRGLGRHRQRL